MKVIHILTHSLSIFKIEDTTKLINYSWHTRFAREILNQARHFEMECWHPEVASKQASAWEDRGITHKMFPSHYLLPLKIIQIKKEWSPSLLKQLKQEVEKDKVLIHIYGVFTPMTYAIAHSFAGLPIVASEGGNGSAWHGFLEGFRYRKIRTMAVNAAGYLLEFIPQRVVLKNIDHFFVVNDDSKGYLSNLVGASPVEVVALGVDFNRFRPMNKIQARRKLNLDDNKKYILYVGVLVRLKGVDYLFYAFPKVLESYPNSVILLAGDGYYREKLKLLAKELGIAENVKFLGYIDNDSAELPLLYNAADISIMPSWHQPFSMPGVESMACGTPFIGTSLGGIPKLIEKSRGGLLIPPRDPDAIAEAILKCFSGQVSFNIDRENLRKCYDWKAITEHIVKVYEALFAKYY